MKAPQAIFSQCNINPREATWKHLPENCHMEEPKATRTKITLHPGTSHEKTQQKIVVPQGTCT